MTEPSYIELSQKALSNNIKFVRKMLGSKTILSSVVKGNAYGHSIETFVPLAVQCGVKHFSVFNAKEALRIQRIFGSEVTILIMGMIDDEELKWAIESGVEFYVFDIDRLKKAREAAEHCRTFAKIHIEVETGMNRTGFDGLVWKQLIVYLLENREYFSMEGLCTHYAGAESIANYYRIVRQQKQFDKASKYFEENGVIPGIKHSACSAAAMRYPKTRMDLARIGILQYGFFPSREVLVDYLTKNKRRTVPLERVLSWKSRVMDLKKVSAGEFIGYGTAYLTNVEMTIAIVPVGYSQSYRRSLSNKGRVLIRGQRVSVVGIINMNMLTIDVTNTIGVERGDEVVLIGKQGDLEVSVSSFSDFSDQLNYESLTLISTEIPRIIVQ